MVLGIILIKLSKDVIQQFKEWQILRKKSYLIRIVLWVRCSLSVHLEDFSYSVSNSLIFIEKTFGNILSSDPIFKLVGEECSYYF